MQEWFQQLHPVAQAALAGCFTWGVTLLGAALVFFARSVNQTLLDIMLAFAAGVMIAASFWSLLAPSIEMASAQGMPSWVPPAVGFLLGGVFLRLGDALLPHLHPGKERSQAEGVRTAWQRTTLLVLAITLHNVPEGLAVGGAFGATAASGIEAADAGTLGAAIALTIGIGLQNFPEGVAVSMPLRAEGMPRLRSFWYGQLSALVEPVAAVVGEISSSTVRRLCPRIMMPFCSISRRILRPAAARLALTRLIARPAPWQVLPKVSRIAFSVPVST
jgi:zinc transporter, ZIP family